MGGLSAFSSRGGREEKLRCALFCLPLPHSLLTLGVRGCGTSGPRVLYRETDPIHIVVAFKVYDMDRDNFISNGELFLVLKMMVGNNLKVRSLFMANVT